MDYTFKGGYNTATAYVVKDVVSHQPTINDPVKYYFCLTANTGQTPLTTGDSVYWGLINQLSNFPNKVDSFLFKAPVQPSDKTDIDRITILTLQQTLTQAEQDELNTLITKHRNKYFLAEDMNAIQDAISNLQMFFKDGVEPYIANAQTEIISTKDSALLAIETKKNNVIEYLDGTTAGELRNDIGFMGELTTTDTTSLVASNNEIKSSLDGHKVDDVNHVRYGIATGTANTYAVTLNPTPTVYVEGMAISVKINVNSSAASTMNVNGLGAKGIKKANGTDVTNLKANGIYTLRYDGVNFILQGEGGSGNATASDLLSGKTATVDAGEIVGIIPSKSAQTYTPGTTNQTISAGQYLNGIQTIAGDADLIASNILSGKNIFGVAGSVIAGKRWATGTTTSSSISATFEYAGGGTASRTTVTVTGLSFKPSSIYAYYWNDATNEYVSVYSEIGYFYPKTVKVFYVTSSTNGGVQGHYKGDTYSASVINGSFTIPVGVASASYTWLAIE